MRGKLELHLDQPTLGNVVPTASLVPGQHVFKTRLLFEPPPP